MLDKGFWSFIALVIGMAIVFQAPWLLALFCIFFHMAVAYFFYRMLGGDGDFFGPIE